MHTLRQLLKRLPIVAVMLAAVLLAACTGSPTTSDIPVDAHTRQSDFRATCASWEDHVT
jgi:type IV pilus biogenesis protein CpaD/CtpE